ncbi:Protein TIC 62, chloroplastic, partial [Mucuna pruriens]
IAELMAVMAKNRDLSYCKIVETIAPLTPTEELLAKIPSQHPYISSPYYWTHNFNRTVEESTPQLT